MAELWLIKCPASDVAFTVQTSQTCSPKENAVIIDVIFYICAFLANMTVDDQYTKCPEFSFDIISSQTLQMCRVVNVLVL